MEMRGKCATDEFHRHTCSVHSQDKFGYVESIDVKKFIPSNYIAHLIVIINKYIQFSRIRGT